MNRSIRISAAVLAALALAGGAAFALLPLPGTVPVLMYHFIGTAEDAAHNKNYITRKSLERQMEFLRRFHYRVITLDELYEIKTGQRKPRGRQIVITFDDGNSSFEKEAVPILQRYRFPVTNFIVSGNGKKQAHGSMSEEAVRRLLRYPWFHIGGHSKTHPSLTGLAPGQIREELAGSKEDLESAFGVPVFYLAYPNGEVDGRAARIAEASGYRLAFTTGYRKLKKLPEGLFTMTRVKISRTSDYPFVFWFKISGIYQLWKRTRSQVKQWKF